MHYCARLLNAQQGHEVIMRAWTQAKPYLLAGHRLELAITPERRSTAQNSRLWASLTEVAEQVDWHGQKLTPAEWKDVLSASLKRQKVVPGLDGGFVVLGSSTSRMTKGELSELLELLYAFGAQHGVHFTDPQTTEQPGCRPMMRADGGEAIPL
jgi:hypothetical protein